MFIYRRGYTKWYTFQTCLSNTQSSNKLNYDTISEDTEMVKIWTEYCSELYNHPINPDQNILIKEN